MILSVFVIIFVALIAYLHYVQGLLNGLISVVLAIASAMLALSYYEPVAAALSGGKYNDASQGLCMVALFALTYLLGRVLFDKLIPGNVRIPNTIDRIGGAVLGLVAGVFGTGIVAIALQSMPFGPSVGGHARYPLTADKEISVAGQTGVQKVDRIVHDPLKNDNLIEEPAGLLLPVDDIVLAVAKHLSRGGSLAGDQPLEYVHPDLLQEFFAQRLGIETGAKRTIWGKGGSQQATVPQAYVLTAALPRVPSELPKVHETDWKGELKAPPGQKLVALTVMFKPGAADDDGVVRLSPGSVRLVTKSDDGWKNSFPVGTAQIGQAWMNKPDDFLFVDTKEGDRGAHFLFLVDDSALVKKPAGAAKAGGDAGEASYAFAPEVFVEVKRTVRVSLEDVKIETGMPPDDPKFFPMRKANLYKEGGKGPLNKPKTMMSGFKDPGWGDAELTNAAAGESNFLPVWIGVPAADGDVATPAVTGHLTGKQFDKLEVNVTAPGAALAELPKGTVPANQLMVPAGKRMVQVGMSVKDGAQWAWASPPWEYTVIDGSGNEYKPVGFFGTVTEAGGAQKFLARYQPAGAELGPTKRADGATMTSVTLVYLLPPTQKAKEVRFRSKPGGLPLEK